jgi:hypothetical protein
MRNHTARDAPAATRGVFAKKRATNPRAVTVSYRWAISIIARVRPENSVVTPRTSTWWA